MDIEQFLDSPESLLILCKDVIAALDSKRKGSGLDDKEQQLKAICNSIDKLEKLEVAVPEPLRALKSELITQLAVREEVNRTFENLADGLEDILKDLCSRTDRVYEKEKGPKRHTQKSRQPITSGEILRQEIISALKMHGGSARVSQVILEIKKRLNGKLTPRDLERRQTGEVIWENNTQWERLKMVNEGILRENTPHGIWELNKEYL